MCRRIHIKNKKHKTATSGYDKGEATACKSERKVQGVDSPTLNNITTDYFKTAEKEKKHTQTHMVNVDGDYMQLSWPWRVLQPSVMRYLVYCYR